MKIAYFDAFSGIAGDMTVGALLDAGADQKVLLAGLDSLATGARFTIEKVRRQGLSATQFRVEFEHQHTHRHLPHIVKMIEAAALPDGTKQKAIKVFETLGAAEARVHGVPVEKVHFHEVGAVDSICDIVGASLGLELLGVNAIYASAVNTGSGTVVADHGVMPVPAPATALLLEGLPVYARGPETELTTPTGAAILKALGAGFGALPAMRVEASGFGAGTKDFAGTPNVLRVIVGQPSGAPEATRVNILTANIDDATPEVLGYAMECLLAAGALDVTLAPIYMKKQRAATRIEVLSKPEDRERLAEILLKETTSFGLRIAEAERRVQARRIVEVRTPYGTMRVKVAPDGAASPEYEDCRHLAQSTGTPLKEILAAAAAAYRSL